jgi:site-specific recombinase XerD
MERKSEFVLGDKGQIVGGFKAALKEAGIEGVTPHTLRHTFATHLARRGVPLLHIAQLLGDDPLTVSKRYAHHQPQDLISAVNAMVNPLRSHTGS